MPAPARTSIDAIVRAAADLLEADGPAGMSMQAVGARVGVRAPSLYKHVSGRGALVRLVAEDAARDLGERLDASAPFGTPPKEALGAAARKLTLIGIGVVALFLVNAYAPEPLPEHFAASPMSARRRSGWS